MLDARVCGGVAGRFIMSINDTSFIRETFAGFRIDDIETTWTISSAAGRGTCVKELIVSNGG